MRARVKRIAQYIPPLTYIVLPLFLLSAVIHAISLGSPAFADFFNINIAGFFRRILSYLTSWLPFSLGEMIIFSLFFLVVFLIVYAVRVSRSNRRAVRLICILLSVIMLVYVLFVMTFALGYQGTTLEEKLALENVTTDSATLYETAQWLSGKLRELQPYIVYADGASVMPQSDLSELSDSMLDAYGRVHEKYPFINDFYSQVKGVAASEYMSYLHILGVYSYFTGEANVNTNPPDYTIPYTVAHEMAHQRGIAREDEANFVAFLVCIEADDAYIQYSGYLSVFEYVVSSLRRTDESLTVKYPYGAYLDRVAYSEYYEKYEDNAAGELSNKVNDAYLKSQGTQGRISYNMVTTLAVKYYYSCVRG